ncbi:hypothetical protein [Streptococcus phage P738]|nr:hypothetical protein [Streptococcus phage P738]
MIDKERLIERLEENKYIEEDNGYRIGFNKATETAIYLINQLNWPEKTILSKEEAEWLEKLIECYDLTEVLYTITHGYNTFMSVKYGGELYSLPTSKEETAEDRKQRKKRLTNAVVYGYEVNKGKLYTARVKGLEVEYDKVYINQDKKTGELFIDDLDEIDGVFKVYFTKEELEKLGLWGNVLIEIEEG